MAWFRRHRRKFLYGLLALTLLIPAGIWGGLQYFKSRFFMETPNTLQLTGELQTVPFIWVKQTFSDEYVEPHSAILLSVKVPGIDKELHMQFDTGSPYTFLRSGCLDSLKERGIDCDVYAEDGKAYVRDFTLNIRGNTVVLKPGRVMMRDIKIDWEKPYNNIGTIGADFIDNLVCAIDFPAEEIHLARKRPPSFSDLGTFHSFDFKARRVMLPTTIDETEMQVFWDSGCSSFGLFTSKYHYDRLVRADDKEIVFQANRFGDKLPVHHRPSDLAATFGATDVPLQRVSYVGKYAGLQKAFGRFIDGGFLGNKSFTNSTLILDTIDDQFLVINGSLPSKTAQVD